MVHNDHHVRAPLAGLKEGRGGGGYTGAWGAVEGGSGSVERDRQNRDLYSNWTKCCENPAERSEKIQHRSDDSFLHSV